MPPLTATVDETYREYAGLLLRRHHLLLEGKDDDPQTEEVEDRLSVLWEQMDEEQRRSLNGVSSDLNWVRRGGLPAPKARTPEAVGPEEQDILAAAKAGSDWHAVLHHLRVCTPVIAPEDLARRRQEAYEAIG